MIRDLKIIQGGKGCFVAMPSRRLMDRCTRCHTKNHLRSRFCNHCGGTLSEDRSAKDFDGRAKLYADIAHPINSRCRELIQTEVIKAFREEQIRAKQPGYICSYDDYGEESFATLEEEGATIRLHRTVGEPDSVHRIDQPSNGINAPHHGAPRIAGRVSAEREEGFGSGIL